MNRGAFSNSVLIQREAEKSEGCEADMESKGVATEKNSSAKAVEEGEEDETSGGDPRGQWERQILGMDS